MESITSTLKYDQYSDSGYEWIGEIPEHWDLVKLGSCLSPVSVKNCPELPLLSITREQGVIERDVDNQESNHNFIPDDLSGYKKLEKGQFGMNKMKAWQGSYGVSKFTGIVSPAYFIFDFTKAINPEFFNWAIRSKLYVSFFGSASDGVRIGQWDLSKARMKVIPFVLPSEEEQSLIANFLDKKTALIDEAISIKEQQISLLKERKQIIIQQAVTQGLDPNVPMKDSGVDWIGEIPEHWEIIPLKHLCKFSGGGTPSKDNLTYWEGGTIPWVSPKDMKSTYIFETQDYVTEKAVKNSSTNFVAPNSLLLVVRSGILQRKIPVAINTVEVTLNQDMKSLTFNHHMTIEFMLNFIVGNNDSLLVEWTKEGATVESIEHEYLANGLVCVPPVSEQNAINEYLSSFSMQLESAISLQAEQIEKLKEYKTTLINSAVTGKIKITPEMVEQ
ncbi:TPA: restriction endonuclease subunit S [Escherichia coli]|nr:restriction endonuclease subunit S [Escherichia coli]